MRQLPSSVIALWLLSLFFFGGGTFYWIYTNTDTHMGRSVMTALSWAHLPDVPKTARGLNYDAKSLPWNGEHITISFAAPLADTKAWIGQGLNVIREPNDVKSTYTAKGVIKYKLDPWKGSRNYGSVNINELTGQVEVEIVYMESSL